MVPGRAAFSRAYPVYLVLGVTLLGLNLRISSSSIPPVLADLGLPGPVAGILAASPAICFGVMAFASPWVLRTWGVERGLMWALGVLIAGIVLRSMWAPFGYLPGSLVAGTGVAVMNVLLPTLVRSRFPSKAGPVTAAYLGALTIGGAAAAAFTVPLRHLLDNSVPLALATWALPAIVAFVIWLPQAPATPAVKSISRPMQSSVYSSGLAWMVTIFFGLQSMVYFGALSWLPTYYRGRGLSPEVAGLLLALLNATGLVGNVLTPLIVSRTADQRWAAVLVSLLTALGLAGVIWGSPNFAVIWIVVLSLGGSGSFSLALLFVIYRSAGAESATALSTMTQGIGYLLSACGPLIVGLLHAVTGSWAVAMGALLVLTVPQLAVGVAAGRNRVIGAGT
jgi:CP family cyanate transporter-like MFS transporter